ncbi:hypothetical protein [Proteus hauseri]|uniref:hypothetical protein n=1 Tax=Proteus hauseri TaxID=183417 RepID=UPI0032DABE28
MSITFQTTNNSGKVVGIGSNEKSKSIFSKLASSINSIKNNIANFFNATKSNVTIENPINLNQIQKDLLGKNEEEKNIRQTYNKHSSKNLKESIQASISKYPQEIEYKSFENYNNPQAEKINLNRNLWISTVMRTDEPQLENKGSVSRIQYESSPYFQSISNKNTFKN